MEKAAKVVKENSLEENGERGEKAYHGASKLIQVFVACSISFGAIGVGYGNSWPSPALTDLQDCEDDPEYHPDGCTFDQEFTEEEGSWIASMFTLGALFSSVGAFVSMQFWGRKPTLQIASIPYILGWSMLAVAEYFTMDTTAWFYSARFLTGFGSGLFLLTGPVYVMEMCQLEIRGTIGNLISTFSISGALWANLFGAFLDWPALSLIALIPPITTLLVLSFVIPESPFYLITQGKIEKAGKSMQKLRGIKYDISHELRILQESLEEIQRVGKVSWKDLVTKRVYIVPLSICMILQIFGQLTGISAATLYLAEIFLKAGFDVDNSLYQATAVAAFQVAGAICSLYLVETQGRKFLLMVSGLGVGLSMTALATYFYMDDHKEVICQDKTSGITSSTSTLCIEQEGFSLETMDKITWLPVLSLVIFKFTFALGYGTVPVTLCGEFFSSEAKDVSAFISMFSQFLFVFLVGKYQVDLEDMIGTAGLYYTFGACGLTSVLFTAIFVPETKGRTPEDMKEIFRKNNFICSNYAVK